MKKGLKVSELLSENDRLVRRVLSLSEDNLGLTQENDALIDDIDVLTSEIEEIKRDKEFLLAMYRSALADIDVYVKQRDMLALVLKGAARKSYWQLGEWYIDGTFAGFEYTMRSTYGELDVDAALDRLAKYVKGKRDDEWDDDEEDYV